MRRDELKFRVWDNLREVFFEGDLYLNDEGKVLEPNEDYISGFEELKEGRYVVERCTGILDKVGTLIYQGDILRNINNEKRYKVVWWGCSAHFEMVEIPETAENRYNKSMYFANQSLGRYEMIGNIHDDNKNEKNNN